MTSRFPVFRPLPHHPLHAPLMLYNHLNPHLILHNNSQPLRINLIPHDHSHPFRVNLITHDHTNPLRVNLIQHNHQHILRVNLMPYNKPHRYTLNNHSGPLHVVHQTPHNHSHPPPRPFDDLRPLSSTPRQSTTRPKFTPFTHTTSQFTSSYSLQATNTLMRTALNASNNWQVNSSITGDSNLSLEYDTPDPLITNSFSSYSAMLEDEQPNNWETFAHSTTSAIQDLKAEVETLKQEVKNLKRKLKVNKDVPAEDQPSPVQKIKYLSKPLEGMKRLLSDLFTEEELMRCTLKGKGRSRDVLDSNKLQMIYGAMRGNYGMTDEKVDQLIRNQQKSLKDKTKKSLQYS
ncbi:LIM domain-containing protein A isoform X2 [Nematostella vectensis]|uniref:LIM domain-containing protein A isoform X2 n=1 Tax=Nematostella vectensis TaxID=45351 RepID=UPI002077269B|nr:LIM domain-containing protein A isoform X2 [Nematostella vectensis]